ncbi:MAG: ribose-phosphate pyrophosphokinase [Clostridiales bacterium]|jgi:ribose-phosphate pyrophosphokinase|nr:ribose-phosphate pyrophosphokinase [Clostridiales bacterium]
MVTDINADSTFGQLGIIALKSAHELGEKVNRRIIERRRNNIDFQHDARPQPESYMVAAEEVRFSNGEGKVKLRETVRGKDIYLLCDIGNYNCTYDMYGFTNHMGPDEHFQDVKRTISAIGGKARRTTLIMPLLYASRQDKRKGRESLDCAMALQEIANMGVNDIVVFDVHATSVQNSIPLVSFENLYTTFDIIKALLDNEKELASADDLIVISPDTGGMERAIFYASVLGADVGLFYKRRDYKVVVNGRNPIVAHQYMGRSVEGQNVLIVDDMIATGDSIVELAVTLNKMKARRIFVAAAYALFTEGVARFDRLCRQGLIDRVYSTNLSYTPPELRQHKWYKEVDMSDLLARLIDFLNYSRSLAPLLDANESIKELFHTKTAGLI